MPDRPGRPSRRRFRWIRPEQRLILKYIFPGGELDHIGHTCESLENSRFEVHDVEDWREHYALTTRLWCQRLSARREEAIAMVGPERYRLWVAYLAGVSFAFLDGSADLPITSIDQQFFAHDDPDETPLEERKFAAGYSVMWGDG